MSNHIRFRRGQGLVPGEIPAVAEPIWDHIKSKLGMFNNVGDAIEWYPRTYDEVLQLNANQFLTGETAAGGNNNVYLDFSVPNELIVRNEVSGAVLARFTDSASYLLNPVAAATAEVGISNRAINGNLALKFRSPAAAAYPVSTIGLTASVMIAPNWMLWKAAGSSGSMSVGFDEAVHPAGTERSFLINATGAVNGSGLRCFIHDYETVRNREVIFYGDYNGPMSRSCMMRVSNAFGEIFSQEFALNPLWETKSFAVNIPDVDGQFLAVDFIYNPSRTNPALATFRAGKFGISLGQVLPRYESRSEELERSLACGLFKEGAIHVNGATVGSIDLGLAPGTGVELRAHSTAGAVTLQSVDSFGAVASIAGATGLNRISYVAASVIRTAETN